MVCCAAPSRYNHYKEQMDIVDGKIPMKTLDDQFCLTFVFANCKIHMTVVCNSIPLFSGNPSLFPLHHGVSSNFFITAPA